VKSKYNKYSTGIINVHNLRMMCHPEVISSHINWPKKWK